jgi:hypothetical protein
MRTFGIIAASLVVLIVGAVVAYRLAYPTYSHRYRLTLEVETPDGLKKGSSVIESSARGQPLIGSAVTRLEGDAVFVDLGKGKNIVALLALGDPTQIDGPVRLAINAFAIPNCKKPFCQWKLIARTAGARDLPAKLIPTLATVGDVTDPKTARVIEPDAFEALFGSGYHFKRAWIEMTNEPVTRTIDTHLKFYDKPAESGAFWKALLTSGFKPECGMEPYGLLRRGV